MATTETSTVRAIRRERGSRHRLEHLMGMPIVIDVCDPDFDADRIDRVYDWLARVDATFSTYRADSQISRLNRSELALADADPVVRSILARCQSLRDETDGYFDAWAVAGPARADGQARVDPSGLVKGWAIERAAGILEENGARNFCINAGGDVALRGHPEDARYWRIGIQHPRARDRVAVTLVADRGAIATSGAYERGRHIIDPHTRRRLDEVLSVTVAGPDLGTADAYATAIYAMGASGPAWALGLREYAVMVILADDSVLSTPHFDRYRLPSERLRA